MVQSTAASVDEYMKTVEPERADAMARLRALCLRHLPGWEERMQWGMPGYAPPGKDAAVSFNSQKNYISVYPGRAALAEHKGKMKGASFGGGCVRFAKPERIDFEAVAAMLRHAFVNKG